MALVFGPVALLGSSRVAIVVARQVHRFRANADAASAPAPARWRRSSCRGVSACALGRKTPDRSRRFRPPLRRTRTCSRGYFLSGGRDDSGAEDAGGRCQGRLEGPPRRGVRPPSCLPVQPTLRARHGLATGRRSAPVQTVNATAAPFPFRPIGGVRIDTCGGPLMAKIHRCPATSTRFWFVASPATGSALLLQLVYGPDQKSEVGPSTDGVAPGS
jgi:hypothetical protein